MRDVEGIRRALRMQPFRPFSLKMVDGTVYTVQHHDWLSIPPVRRPREITYYVVTDPGTEEYETHWIDLGLVAGVIVPPGPTALPATPKTEGDEE
jgi:hypothetical protein